MGDKQSTQGAMIALSRLYIVRDCQSHKIVYGSAKKQS